MILIGCFVLVTIIVGATAQVNGSEKIVFCYWDSNAHYRPQNGQFLVENIDPMLCTHIGYTFFGINSSGVVESLNFLLDYADDYGVDNIAKTIALKQINPNLKVLATIGGWEEGSRKYSNMAADPNKRAVFINSVIPFLKQHKFDGLDFDWEYPNQRGGVPADKDNYITLLRELKANLKQHNFSLTVAVAATEASANLSYNISALSNIVDLINIKTYNFGDSCNKYLSFNAPLQGPAKDPNTVTAAINYWLSAGAKPSKLVLGIPFYGRTFIRGTPNLLTVNSPAYDCGYSGPYTRTSGFLGYNEFCETKNLWTEEWDANYLAPYAYKGNQWIGYDNSKSIQLKINFIKEKKLGGAMVWSLDTDDFNGNCFGKKYPLLSQIHTKLSQS